ncbi:MAG: thymidine phosphorylase [Christensenellales bacterium]|jgi:pyrimidine-nucleoside phosphorylase
MYDIIAKKRDGRRLSEDEIRFFAFGAADGSIPDYQLSALLMAIYINGMDAEETAQLTIAMADSGETADLSGIEGIKCDKHSTGGVGDTTTLIIAPLVAACGGRVAKMSGRGLGHTGGTIDKLEAIPGFEVLLSAERFSKIVNEVGVAVAGQSHNLAPADGALYALRDVTATVESIPLIASSIMSKKLASGSDAILLDVKTGGGAFMKTQSQSVMLAKAMVDIGKRAGRKMRALITRMDAPLGNAVGNAIEVMEAVMVLKGEEGGALLEVSLELAAHMLEISGVLSLEKARIRAAEALLSGEAYDVLKRMVAAQGGNAAALDDFSMLPKSRVKAEVKAESSGRIEAVDALIIGEAAQQLGAGRAKKGDSIDAAAGIWIKARPGDEVVKGQTLAVLHAADEKAANAIIEKVMAAFRYGDAVVPEYIVDIID